jgi:hypothetical protein
VTKNWETVQIPLAAGLDTKSDVRSGTPPQFDILKDAEFEEPGGLQTRKPFGSIGTNIYGGGTLADIRRIVENGDELLAFTKDKLYSWSSALSLWFDKGTHLACKVREETTFATTGDQLDADRAELGGVVVLTWTEAGFVYVAAKDSAGGTILAPTKVGTGGGVGTRPRLVALTTKILLFWHTGTDAAPVSLVCVAISVADVLSSILTAATTVLATPNFGSYYDVCKVPGADQAIFACRRVVTTSYTIGTITAALALSTSVKARTCVMPIAVACDPGGLLAQVARSNAGAVVGDQITIATLADTANINVAIGTYTAQLNQITAAFRSAKVGGLYRCHVFWSYNEDDDATNWQSTTNFINDNGTVGAEAVFVRRLGIASRAFEYDGRVYVWTAFAGASSFTGANVPGFRAQLQNSYFLYREADHTTDPFLVAKAAFSRAGGFCPSTGRLPGVELVSGTTGFAWCATERRIVPLGVNQTGYGARAPRDVTFTFDSDEARRTVRLGATLYVTGGEILQYDGNGLYEVGFHVYPYHFAIAQGIGGLVPNGAYDFKLTHRWDNAQGERERSTTATVAEFTIAAGPASFTLAAIVPLYVTHKIDRPPALEVWRTELAPEPGDPFYLATGLDPGVTVNPNGFRVNDPTASTLGSFADVLIDADLSIREPNPENGAVLENLAPPAATIVMATADRLFLAGVAGEPNRVWYSKLRNAGEVAAFHDGNVVAVPAEITGLGLVNETPIAFCEIGVYALDGQGVNNLGEGQNYGPARQLSNDVGALNHESIASTPGGAIFKSAKGWYLVNRGWSCEYIGAPVSAYDSETILAVHVVESQHQVRCLSASRLLVYDYYLNQWAEWTVSGMVAGALLGGVHHVATATDVKAQRSDYTGINYGLEAKLAPVKLNDLQGAGSVRWIEILGEYRGGHRLEVMLYRDYATTPYQTTIWTPSPTTVGEPLQVSVGPSIPKCMAIGVHIKALPAVVALEDVWSEALKLTGLALDVGRDRGLNRRLPAAQKT